MSFLSFLHALSCFSAFLRAALSSFTADATDRAAAGEGWNARWNSSYRPVVWGCTFSDGALVSFVLTQTSISNTNLSTQLTAPVREGYTFAGWSTQAGGAAEYSLNGLSSVPFGTTLYAVWTADNANA